MREEVKRASKRRPTHPGAILREDVLLELGITQAELARCLQLSNRAIAEIIHERKPVTPDIAMRLSRFLGTTVSSWLSMQRNLDIWELERANREIYKKIKPLSGMDKIRIKLAIA